ncbi:MAG: hypothetical protein COV55_03845 [Candidatus Komeilibacteria bacterium CG11_big_fil_rev_8_21_14_0_20_36_20]|uniref:Phage holin family protein n=1 Tax=Candidatus Komeilibacteria bacterium CG11_big_fil_rev_8_21_14_0_20_36_20 TaxID=1974477 RepID=A0A2H0NBW0_9BACT|nr:MAG: hypothetical protein COV55_03845 [Candidatus Komeilibacteria bacterium CG11_big_fil_rev_8_21_14_0_20_36_20]PIR81963.1 MAG: hypothetical protein COU21_00480 [Candidatus Komeilibacteria bacterium CG10_big_fil_rev_8_21_14_0_10_36_65]PJC55500.1 MAG: hypothetical protein CO027_01480 [Candidatus Komeilibacteria bacterium CG_4_9_14_0_2_um_filter_36_13]
MTVLLSILEKLLVIVCKTLFYVLKIIYKFIKFIAELITFLLCFMIFVWTYNFITTLPIFWQSWAINFVLFSASFLFICIIVLRFWKPKLFFQISD